ncbi:hypothetical protein F4860DRAFT_497802 [Xylaria cubensis]|nr:hypothetical protein F4860DRAFT_497802 [Xylaria cubensis]
MPVVLIGDTTEAREKLIGHSEFDHSVYLIDRFPSFGYFIRICSYRMCGVPCKGG